MKFLFVLLKKKNNFELIIFNSIDFKILYEKINFGQYKGKSLQYILDNDFNYIIWLKTNHSSINKILISNLSILLERSKTLKFEYNFSHYNEDKNIKLFSNIHGEICINKFFIEFLRREKLAYSRAERVTLKFTNFFIFNFFFLIKIL